MDKNKLFFDADDGAGAGGAGSEPKTFTQEELDKIVSERIARERKSIDAQIEAAKKEAEKLARMTAEEKAKAEQEALQASIAQREAEITKRELRATGLEELSKKNLPSELIGLLKLDSEESYKESLGLVEKGFLSAVQAGVEGRLKGNTPKDKEGSADDMSAYREALGLPTKKEG